jgi:hypothetical protein
MVRSFRFEEIAKEKTSKETQKAPRLADLADLGASMVGYAESVRTSNPKTTPGR